MGSLDAIKPYTCFCGEKFWTSDAARVHAWKHHPERMENSVYVPVWKQPHSKDRRQ